MRTIVVGVVAVVGTAGCGGAKPEAPPLPVTVMQVSGSGAGGGLRYAKGAFGLGFDYAYKNYGLLGGVNMLGMAINW